MSMVAMSQTELSRFDTLLRVERRELRLGDAAALLGMSRRHVSRLLVRSKCQSARRRDTDVFFGSIGIFGGQIILITAGFYARIINPGLALWSAHVMTRALGTSMETRFPGAKGWWTGLSTVT